MAGPMNVKTTVRPTFVPQLARGPEMYLFLDRAMRAVAEDTRAHAPVKSGAGRRSITGSVVMTAEGWIGVTSWDEAHYYLSFQDARHPFAEPALARVRFV